jgi:hypothetical protein
VGQPDPLLVLVQRGPVGQPGSRGRHGPEHARAQQHRRGAAAHPEQVEQHRRGPAAERQPDQRRVRRLPERHAVQDVGPWPGRQRPDDLLGQERDRPVEHAGALDALGQGDGTGKRGPAAPPDPDGGVPHT